MVMINRMELEEETMKNIDGMKLGKRERPRKIPDFVHHNRPPGNIETRTWDDHGVFMDELQYKVG